ncbi:MAG: acetylxylan esterase [Lentisphaerae bacterium]|nr:acetylxylan esterase [Lentisphaerota bacterium]
MKKILSIIVWGIAAVCFAAPLKDVYINGSTNKSPLTYQKNEEMVFSFEVVPEGNSLEGLFLKYTRHGDDGKTSSGKVPASEKLVVKTSLDRAGFVGISVYLVDSVGIRMQDQEKRNIMFYAGAAVDPEKLTDCGEPEDFDEFWKAQRAKLDKVPFKELVERKFVKSDGKLNFYTVSIPCAGPRPATGFLCIPVNAKKRSLLADVHFMGYGTVIQRLPGWALKDRITLIINAHGYEMLRDDAYYKNFFQQIRSNGHAYAFDPIENQDREKCYFNGMSLRVMRSLDYIKTVPEWNGRVLRVTGGSQGGLQTMWAAALDKDITEAIPSITWCCDMAGQSKKQRYHGTWRVPYTRAMDYFDPVFMAKRVKTPYVYISRAGMGDYICPPSGLAVCWNNLDVPHKKMVWVQGSTHGFIPKKSDRIVWEVK